MATAAATPSSSAVDAADDEALTPRAPFSPAAMMGASIASFSPNIKAFMAGSKAIADSPALPFRIARSLVSGSKMRFKDGGFDLGLSYVVPRVIALGLPATGLLEPLVLFTIGIWVLFALAILALRRVPTKAAIVLVLVGSVAVGGAAMAGPPNTSTDSARYAWDGIVQNAGISPYDYAPADPALRELRPEWLFPAVVDGKCPEPRPRMVIVEELETPAAVRMPPDVMVPCASMVLFVSRVVDEIAAELVTPAAVRMPPDVIVLAV